jgi:polyisoprenoid-binding protein YceI
MKKIILPVALFATITLSAYTAVNTIVWKVKEGFAIKFSGTDANGAFENFKGNIQFDEKNPENSKFDIVIETASIATGNGMKNRHAKSDKWFSAKQFPTIQFVSNKVTNSNGQYIAQGILTMHGVEKLVSIPFTFSKNVFHGTFSVNRMDFGVGDMEGMSKKVSNQIDLDITVPVTE